MTEQFTTYITYFFALLILGAFIYALFIAPKQNRRAIASLCVSLGICGTFIGIAVGLWYFEVRDLQGSAGFLIGGMKIAFISSACGIAASVFLRFLDLLANRKEAGTTAKDIHGELTALRKDINLFLENATQKVNHKENRNNQSYAVGLGDAELYHIARVLLDGQ